MKIEVTEDELDQMINCIVDCDLDRDEALEYAKRFLFEDTTEMEW